MVRRTRSLLLLPALLAACGDELPAPDIVARVGGEEIGLATFENYLESSSIDLDAGLDDRVLSQLFDQFLDETLVLRLAIDDGIVTADASRRDALEMLVRLRAADEPDAERVRLYHQAHADRFSRPERVRLSQILVDSRAAAERALEELRSGVPFPEVARRLSTEPAAAIGGDQGFLARDDLPPAFVETIFDLGIGEISEIVTADYGFHIFQVTDRRPAEVVTEQEAVGEIREHLRRTESAEIRLALVEEARARYNTSVYASNLPFDYRGVHARDGGRPAP